MQVQIVENVPCCVNEWTFFVLHVWTGFCTCQLRFGRDIEAQHKNVTASCISVLQCAEYSVASQRTAYQTCFDWSRSKTTKLSPKTVGKFGFEHGLLTLLYSWRWIWCEWRILGWKWWQQFQSRLVLREKTHAWLSLRVCVRDMCRQFLIRNGKESAMGVCMCGLSSLFDFFWPKIFLLPKQMQLNFCEKTILGKETGQFENQEKTQLGFS